MRFDYYRSLNGSFGWYDFRMVVDCERFFPMLESLLLHLDCFLKRKLLLFIIAVDAGVCGKDLARILAVLRGIDHLIHCCFD